MVNTLIDANCEIVLRDDNFEDAGEITKFTQFQATLKLNDIGSWQLDLPTQDYESYGIDETMGILFRRDGVLILSGPVMLIRNTLVSGQKKTVITGGSDEEWLTERICYPVVTGPLWDATLGGWRFGKMRSAKGISTKTTAWVNSELIGTVVPTELPVENAAGFVDGNSCIVVNTNGSMHPRIIVGVDLSKNLITVDNGDIIPWNAGSMVYQTSGGLVEDPKYTGYDTRTGAAERIAKELVYFNAGAGACSDAWGSRATPHLVVAPNLARGNHVTANSRGEVLLNQVQDICASGGINFTLKQVGTDLVFDTYYGRDLTTNSVLIFSVEGGNLKEYDYARGPPSANFVMGSGGGSGIDMLMLPSGDTTSISQYGRRETWMSSVSSQAGDTAADVAANMVQSNNLKLAQTLINSSIALSIQENDQVRYPRDFQLGDRVGFQIGEYMSNRIITNINYSIPVASGGAAGSAITAALPKFMTKQMETDKSVSKALQQLVLH